MRPYFLILPAIVLALAACGAGGGTSGSGSTELLAINTASLPSATVGVPYSATLQASGGQSPYTWAHTGGSLPTGISFDASTATLSGTAASIINTNLTFEVTDSAPHTVATTLTLDVIAPPPLVINTTVLPNSNVNQPYNFAFSATGGVSPYTWTASTLPVGLSIDSSTGALSGTPTSANSFVFDVTVTDALTATATETVGLDVIQGVTIDHTGTLPEAWDGIPYYARVEAYGGTPFYYWNVPGVLPTGLTATSVLNEGILEITGTPTGTGTGNFIVEVTDSAATSIDQLNASITVSAAPAPLTPNTDIISAAMPNAVFNEYYQFEVYAAGGLAPYYWSATGLPTGLYIDFSSNATAIVRGRPLETGEFLVNFTADDGLNSPRSRQISLVVEYAVADFPDGTASTDYDSTVSTVGDGAPTVISASTVAMPGLVSNLGTNQIGVTGTPTTAGDYAFLVQVQDGAFEHYKLLPVSVASAPAALTITTIQLPETTRGSAYNYAADIRAAGGSGTGYSWALAAGSTLPSGITGLPAAGTPFVSLGGSVATAGSFNFTIEVTDSNSNTATQNYTLVVNDPVPGDFNGDGHGDLIAGTDFTNQNGGIRLFLGESAQDRFGDISTEDADLHIRGRAAQCTFGDFNGDGIDDIAMSSTPTASLAGEVSIYYGSATGTPRGVIDTSYADVVIRGTGPGDSFGQALAAEDLDGDDADDLVVGAPRHTGAASFSGRAYVFYGGGLSGTVSVTAADAVFDGQYAGGSGTSGFTTGGYLGDSIELPDLNADGRADMVIGESSRVYVLYSGTSRFSGTTLIKGVADAQFQDCDGSNLEQRLAIGDFNNDGASDLVIGGMHTYLFYGTAGGNPFTGLYGANGASVEFTTPTAASTSIYVGLEALDFNDDGTDDLAFATPENGIGFVFYGSSSSPWSGQVSHSNADVTFSFNVGRDYASWIVQWCDYNNDGRDDLIISARALTVTTINGQYQDAGCVMVFLSDATQPLSGGVSGVSGANVRFASTQSNTGFGKCASGG